MLLRDHSHSGPFGGKRRVLHLSTLPTMTDATLTRRVLTVVARMAVCGAITSSPALSAQQPVVVACNTTVYPNDPDPKGTNIRKDANGKSAAITMIADSDSQVDVTGSSGEWLRIRQVRSVDGTVTFKGEGWVHAPLMAVRTKGVTTLRAAAESASAARGTVADDEQVSILGCRGEWLRVRHKLITGWILKASQCGNPVTTCS